MCASCAATMRDADLAALQQVEIRAVMQAVKRNIERFPENNSHRKIVPAVKGNIEYD